MTARDLERKQLVQTIALIQKEQEIIKKQQEVAADTLQTQLKEVADEVIGHVDEHGLEEYLKRIY